MPCRTWVVACLGILSSVGLDCPVRKDTGVGVDVGNSVPQETNNKFSVTLT